MIGTRSFGPRQTVAIYMGLSSLPLLTEEFIRQGADPEMPAAVIDKGTRDDQRVVSGTLSTLAARAAEAELSGPSMIIIGTVVTLRDKLAWQNQQTCNAPSRNPQELEMSS